jgi:hypothetical protein
MTERETLIGGHKMMKLKGRNAAAIAADAACTASLVDE